MRWLKRDIWKAGITIACMLLLLVLIVWVPVSAAGAYEGASGPATPVTGTVQATPTEDATMTALNKEKLEQEIQQLKNQNEQLKNQNAPDFFVWLPAWLRTNVAILLSTIVVVIGGLIGLGRWLGDRHSEREKRAEERFQKVVEGLGGDKEKPEAKVGAAIMLHTFLGHDYKQFYRQAFELAVAYLQLRQVDPNTPAPIDPLSRALITVFKESFPKTRNMLKQPFRDLLKQYPDFFDASRVHVDNGYFVLCDLKEIWMRDAYLRYADLSEADMSGADLSGACLNGAVLSKAKLSGANIEDAQSLAGTDLRGVKGLTKEQLEACKAKGAINVPA